MIRIALTLVLLAAAGCAPSMATAPSVSSDAETRAPQSEGPTNFASPADLFSRYPAMRRQTL